MPPARPESPPATGIRSLEEFYGLMAASARVRRAAAAAILEGGTPSPGAADAAGRLRRLRAALHALPGAGARRVLQAGPDLAVEADIGDELAGLDADIVFLEQGREALFAHLAAARPGLAAEARALADTLQAACPGILQAWLTDRDGTVAGYCGRYRSSIQPVWNAVMLCGFARSRARRAVLLSSGPLAGLQEVLTMPPAVFDLAGSKGRECLDRAGRRHEILPEPAQQALLRRMAETLEALLAIPDNRLFGLVGSGLQVKAGQLTVARQDATGSVPAAASERFLRRVGALAAALGLTVEDTGLDIEIMPPLDGTGRGFGKAEAVRFLDDALGLGLAAGPVLACGDTAADLPMLAEAAARSPSPFAVLVTRDAGLAAQLPGICPAHAVASAPEVLVAALGMLARTR